MISSTPVQAKPTGGPLSQMRLDIAEYIEVQKDPFADRV